jgi:hypothetical protein
VVFSKCISGGVSAALVLLWWPRLVPGASLSAWLGRGVAFTLAFELLLLALRPLEQTLWGTRSGTRVRERIDTAAERLRRGDTVRRLASSAAIAAVALIVPGLLIAEGLSQHPADRAAKPERAVRIVHVTKVVRPVTVRRVVAETETPAPAAAAPVAPAKRVPAAAKRRTPAKPETSTEVKSPAREPSTTQDSQPASDEKAPSSPAKDPSQRRTASGASLDNA